MSHRNKGYKRNISCLGWMPKGFPFFLLFLRDSKKGKEKWKRYICNPRHQLLKYNCNRWLPVHLQARLLIRELTQWAVRVRLVLVASAVSGTMKNNPSFKHIIDSRSLVVTGVFVLSWTLIELIVRSLPTTACIYDKECLLTSDMMTNAKVQ